MAVFKTINRPNERSWTRKQARWHFSGSEEAVMAKLIDFHVPANYQAKTPRWTPPELRGKIIVFPPTQRKSA
jgi:hypothetical protein